MDIDVCTEYRASVCVKLQGRILAEGPSRATGVIFSNATTDTASTQPDMGRGIRKSYMNVNI
jgi:hypothetical protein